MKSSAKLIREYGAEIDCTVAERAQLTAQNLFAKAFGPGRTPRSEAYRKGVLGQLRYRMEEAAENVCPYKAGTAEFDAFWAGVGEAWNLLETHKCDRRR